MTEINFSYITDSDRDGEFWPALLANFTAQSGVKVNLHPMNWDTAWAELFAYTTTNTPPHVSHVGNTWVSSLARLNVLRPFLAGDLQGLGGSQAFITPNWESGLPTENHSIWAIPWTAWTYVICYRKSLLEQVGIEPQTAFGSMRTTVATTQRLFESDLEIPWLSPRLPTSYRDLLHIGASWIWAAGGDFLDESGERVLFNRPEVLTGLTNLIKTFRCVRPEHHAISQAETFELFEHSQVAAALVNVRAANLFSKSIPDLAVAPVTEVPWIGGGSLVAWQNSPGGPTQQRAALDLIRFITSPEVNRQYWNEAQSLPARLDTLAKIYPVEHPMHQAVFYSTRAGRGYHLTSIWRRIEMQLSQVVGETLLEATENPASEVERILHQHLDRLAQQIEAMLDRR